MRLIDADALADRLYKLSSEYPEDETILRIIAGGLRHDRTFAPTIEAEPVVRCKDCRLSRKSCFGEGWRFCRNNQHHHKQSSFCSYRERKEKHEEDDL